MPAVAFMSSVALAEVEAEVGIQPLAGAFRASTSHSDLRVKHPFHSCFSRFSDAKKLPVNLVQLG